MTLKIEKGGFGCFGGVFWVVTDLKSFRELRATEFITRFFLGFVVEVDHSDAALSKCLHVILNHEGALLAAERKRKRLQMLDPPKCFVKQSLLSVGGDNSEQLR